ncbi:MAG: hypothetical protein LUE99_11625, partial [Bacteroides sp.]|nr:hypothetical protein [Bacteroides sp.]
TNIVFTVHTRLKQTIPKKSPFLIPPSARNRVRTKKGDFFCRYTINIPSKRKELIIIIARKGKRQDFRQICYTFVTPYCKRRMNLFLKKI